MTCSSESHVGFTTWVGFGVGKSILVVVSSNGNGVVVVVVDWFDNDSNDNN